MTTRHDARLQRLLDKRMKTHADTTTRDESNGLLIRQARAVVARAMELTQEGEKFSVGPGGLIHFNDGRVEVVDLPTE